MARKSGGRIKKHLAGAISSDEDFPGHFAYPEEEQPPRMPQDRQPTEEEVKKFMDWSVRDIANKMNMGRKAGGRISKIAKSYKDMTAGAGSGEGRLQKTDIAKRHMRKEGGQVGHRTYRSYKDMDAGAGSGLGRLEKTEIQKHK
jgi:hypothetical protein